MAVASNTPAAPARKVSAPQNSLYLQRRIKNIVAQVLAILATLFGLFWLGWILWTTLSKGDRIAQSCAVHADDAAARRQRRHGQRVHGQRHHEPARHRHRHARGRIGRHLPRRILAQHLGLAARRNGPLRQRHPALGAVDRARPVRLHPRGLADGPLLGVGRRDRPLPSSSCRSWSAPPTKCCAWCRA